MRAHETEHKTFAKPDETREFPRGRSELVNEALEDSLLNWKWEK